MQQPEILFFNHYVNKSGPVSEKLFLSNSGLASSRIQLRPCYLAAKSLNIDCQIYSLDTSKEKKLFDSQIPKICIIGKLNADSEEKVDGIALSYMAAIARLKRRGVHIIVIYSDNHLYGSPKVRELYKDLVFFADTIVCPTNKLKEYIVSTGILEEKIWVIEDPWSLRLHTYDRPMKHTVKIAWFGSGLNIPYLAKEIPKIALSTEIIKPIELSILSSKLPLEELKKYTESLKYDRDRFQINFIEWDGGNQPTQLEQLLEASDFSLLPSDPLDPKKSGVSHNRIVDSSRSGCIPLASPMQSYLQLKKIALLGSNFPQMIEFGYQHRSRLAAKYETHRNKVLEPFSPDLNSKKWTKLLKTIFSYPNYLKPRKLIFP